MTNGDRQKQGGSAFPLSTQESFERGMTLRDYLAGQALVGLTGNLKAADLKVMSFEEIATNAAAMAYRFADKMLAARAVT